MWEHVVDVQTSGNNVTVYVNQTSQFLIYDFAGDAALLPPDVWTPLDGQPLRDILAYNPSAESGPGDVPTKLYGTGPFVFEYYDPTGMYAEHTANRDYFLTTEEIAGIKAGLFHDIGDVDWDGEVWGGDKADYSLAYGTDVGDDDYNPDANLIGETIVDALDGFLISIHWGDKKEYP
jgi:hypothetical protein